MEAAPVSVAADDAADQVTTAPAGILLHGELPMPAAAARPGLRTRVGCIALLFAAMIVTSMFIGVPLAAALHIVLTGYEMGAAAAITIELGLMVAYVILKTETPARV